MKSTSVALNNHLDGEIQTLTGMMKVTLTKYQPRITNITRANPGVVTTRWAHDFLTGDTVKIVNVRGMVGVNRQEFQITKIDEFSFSIGVNTTAYDPYTHKGVAQKVLGFTAFPSDLVFENITYKSTVAYTPDSIRQGSNMAVDSLDARGVLQNAVKNDEANLALDGVTDEDMIAGRWSNAAVEMFLVNYEDLTQGRMILPTSGNFGEVTMHRGVYQAELVSKTARLQEQLNEVYTAQCRADLGDDADGQESDRIGSEPLQFELDPGFGCKVRLEPPVWQASTTYTERPDGDAGLGSVVRPTNDALGRQFFVSSEGVSGTVEPAWNTTVGGTTIDGTVEWTTQEALTKTSFVTAVIDRRRFIDDARYEAPMEGNGGTSTLFPITAVNQGLKRFTIAGELADNFPTNNRFTVVNSTGNDGEYSILSATDSAGSTLIIVTEDIPDATADGSIIGRLPSLVGFFTFGVATFLDGKNKGVSREVKAFSVSTDDGENFTGPGVFELFEAFPFDIEVGASYEVTAGCDKSLVQCVSKFNNVHNRRAEDNIPGSDRLYLYPDSK